MTKNGMEILAKYFVVIDGGNEIFISIQDVSKIKDDKINFEYCR